MPCALRRKHKFSHTAKMSRTCTRIHLIICTHTRLLPVSSALPLFPQGVLAEEVGGAGEFWGWGCKSSTSTSKIHMWHSKFASLSINVGWGKYARRWRRQSPHLTSLVCSGELNKPRWGGRGKGVGGVGGGCWLEVHKVWVLAGA